MFIMNNCVSRARVGKLLTVQGGLMACPGYAQNESNTLVDAEAKLGELIAARPKNIIRGSQGGTSKPLPPGITKKVSHFAQALLKDGGMKFKKKLLTSSKMNHQAQTIKNFLKIKNL